MDCDSPISLLWCELILVSCPGFYLSNILHFILPMLLPLFPVSHSPMFFCLVFSLNQAKFLSSLVSQTHQVSLAPTVSLCSHSHHCHSYTNISLFQTFDECVAQDHSDCSPDNLWMQIPFFCGHAAQCWYVHVLCSTVCFTST